MDSWKNPTKEANDLNNNFRIRATNYGLYLSEVDLETDLAKSSLYDDLKKHYNKRKCSTLVKAMQKHKAQNMMRFLIKEHNKLKKLQGTKICEPLLSLKKTVEERSHPTHD